MVIHSWLAVVCIWYKCMCVGRGGGACVHVHWGGVRACVCALGRSQHVYMHWGGVRASVCALGRSQSVCMCIGVGSEHVYVHWGGVRACVCALGRSQMTALLDVFPFQNLALRMHNVLIQALLVMWCV